MEISNLIIYQKIKQPKLCKEEFKINTDEEEISESDQTKKEILKRKKEQKKKRNKFKALSML